MTMSIRRLSSCQCRCAIVSLALALLLLLYMAQPKVNLRIATVNNVNSPADVKADTRLDTHNIVNVPGVMRLHPDIDAAKKNEVPAATTAEKVASPVVSFDAAKAKLDQLGVLFKRDDQGWTSLACDKDRKLRNLTLNTRIGRLQFYVFDSASADKSVTRWALMGNIFEREEIERFLNVSKDMPLIDLGANVGLVSLQAAMQGRQVLAVEAIAENALRLCRSAVDFGHGHLLHVVNNAVSSREGDVTLTEDCANCSTRFMVRSARAGFRSNTVRAIGLDRLLDVCPFPKAALKIDVESHEGHALHVAHELFSRVDVPFVWMEWEHVKKIKGSLGGEGVLRFMKAHGMRPTHLMTGRELKDGDHVHWPFSVLWVKQY